MTDIYQKQIKLYQEAFGEHGISPQAMYWRNYDSIKTRYEIIIKHLGDFDNKSILELGSGFGDFIPFLEESKYNFKYRGLDIMPEFIGIAKQNHPDYEFKNHNIIEKKLDQKFDIVVSSGAFSVNVPNNYKYRKKAIDILWAHTKEILIFNMQGHYPQPENHKDFIIYYADSLKIIKYCSTLTTRVILDQSYLPNDFTIVMKR